MPQSSERLLKGWHVGETFDLAFAEIIEALKPLGLLNMVYLCKNSETREKKYEWGIGDQLSKLDHNFVKNTNNGSKKKAPLKKIHYHISIMTNRLISDFLNKEKYIK